MTWLVAVVQQWALFIGFILAMGCVSWRNVVGPGAARHLQGNRADALAAMEPNVAWAGVVAGLVVFGAWILRMVAQVMGFRDPFVPLWEDVSFLLFETFWGTVWMAQGLIAVLLTGAFLNAGSRGRGIAADVGSSNWPWRFATILTIALAATMALSSHAVGLESRRALFVAVDGLHAVAAGSWIGSLALILAVGRQVNGVPADDLFAAQIRSFSPMALMSVSVLLSMGIALAWTHLSLVSDLWTMTYGRVLSAKVGMAGAVFAAGFLNWRKGVPALETEAAVRETQRRAAWEVFLAAGVLLLTAVLVHSPKP
jgi:putative copper export protein